MSTENQQQKTEEQMQAEKQLDFAIPDEVQNQGEVITEVTPIVSNDAAQNGLYGLLSLLPIGLNIIGLPRTASVWNDGNCKAVSAAFIPVFRKYEWGQKAITFLETGGGMEEIALMVTLAPLAIGTYSEYRQETANKIEYKKDAENDAKAGAADAPPLGGVHSADTPLGSTFKFASEM